MEACLDTFLFRPYLPTDIPFIQSSWGTNYYKDHAFHNLFTTDEFHGAHRPLRENVFSRESIACIVCAAKEDPDLILGWIIVEKPITDLTILHYLYVKQVFRSNGIARELIKRAVLVKPVVYTHETETAKKIINKKKEEFKNWHYLPHMA